MADLDEVYRQYAQTVYRFLLAKTGSADLSEELTQETFYRAVGSIESYDGSCQMSTWLCAIAKNVLANHIRKQKRTSEEEVPEPTDASAEEYVLQRMGQEAVFAAIHRVSEPGKELLYLRLLGGMSFREIGSIFGKSENWARVCFYRAKQTLIKELKEHENDASL